MNKITTTKKCFILTILVLLYCSLTSNYSSANTSQYLPNDRDINLSFLYDVNIGHLNDYRKNIKFRGSDKFEVKWQKNINLTRNLVQDESGTLFCMDFNELYAVDPHGLVLWRNKLEFGEVGKYMTLGKDGTIYVYQPAGEFNHILTKGIVYAFDKKGNLKWGYNFSQHAALELAHFAGDSNGNFIVETEKGIISINPNGQINWLNGDVIPLSEDGYSTNVKAIDTDSKGNVYLSTNQNHLYSLNQHGKINWDSKNDKIDKLFFDVDNYVVSISSKGLLILSTLNGEEMKNDIIIPLSSNIPTDHNGGYYIGNDKGVVKIDEAGKQIWSFVMKETGYRDVNQLISDKFGNIYFSNNKGTLYSLDKDGYERFIVIGQDDYVDSIAKIIVNSIGSVNIFSDVLGLITIGDKQQPIKVLNNNKELYLSTNPVVKDGFSLVPLREIFEELGATVKWNQEDHSITANKNDTQIIIHIDSLIAQKNNTNLNLDIAPTIIDNKTMVPLRFIGESFGRIIHWDGINKEINLSNSDSAIILKSNDSQPIKNNVIWTGLDSSFHILTEGSDWKAGKYDDLATNTKLFLNNDDKKIFVTKEDKFNFSDDMKLEDYLDLYKKNLNGNINFSHIIFSKIVDNTINGLSSKQLIVTVEVNKMKYAYLLNFIENNKYFYIVETNCYQSNFTRNFDELNKIALSFQVNNE
jgi:hypothetical protein